MSTDANSNRRRSARLPAQLAILVQPLTVAREPVGPPIEGVSLDISQGGVRFVSDRPLLSDFAIVSIQPVANAKLLTMLTERIRCRRVGLNFEIAVRFVEKLEEKI